jgi:hypothetical protein|tara:strand:- start:107 stop:256 length:150 start_codon:yes stop_codon:yes gene_type:complete
MNTLAPGKGLFVKPSDTVPETLPWENAVLISRIDVRKKFTRELFMTFPP